MTDGPRVWIDDRHQIFRQGVVSCLRNDGFTISGESVALDPAPDPSSLDVLVFGVEAPTVQRFIEWSGGNHRLVAVVPPEGGDDLLCQIVEAGVSAVLLRAAMRADQLTSTVLAAHAGTATLPAEGLRMVLDRAGGANGASSARGLAAREVDVLCRLAEGDDTKQIGDELGYSERTVKNIVRDVLMKLHCTNRTHAVAEGLRRGIIE